MKTIVIFLILGGVAWMAINYADRINRNSESAINAEKPTPKIKNGISRQSQDKEIEMIVSQEQLVQFPKIYEGHRIELIGWRQALLETAPEQLRARNNCKQILDFGGGASFGCVRSLAHNIATPFGGFTEDNADIVCTAKQLSHGMIFLSDCDVHMSEYRKMQIREYELETGKTVK